MTGHEDLDDLGPLEVPDHDGNGPCVREDIRLNNAVGPVSIRLRREPSGFIVSFSHGTRHICDLSTKKLPWEESLENKEKIALRLKREDFFKDRELSWIVDQISDCLFDVASTIETDPSYSWVVVSPIVREIFSQVDVVRIWPSKDREQTIFEVVFRVSPDRVISANFSTENWISNRAAVFNRKYVGVFLKTTTSLNSSEWKELREKLTEIAEVREEEDYDYIEDLAGVIISEIRKLNFSTNSSDLADFTRNGYAKPIGNGTWLILVHSRYISTVIERAGTSSRSHVTQIAKFMDSQNMRHSKNLSVRIGPGPSDVAKCWVFDSEYLGITDDMILKEDPEPASTEGEE